MVQSILAATAAVLAVTSTLPAFKSEITANPGNCYYHYKDAMWEGPTHPDFHFQSCPRDPRMGGYASCCDQGDTCLANHVCYKPGSADHIKPYHYLAGTTNPEGTDLGTFANHCRYNYDKMVDYNMTSGMWFCCSWDDKTKTCVPNYSGDTWPGPPPENLAVLDFPLPTTVTVWVPTPTPFKTYPFAVYDFEEEQKHRKRRKIALIAGCIIAVSFLAALLSALLAWFLRRRRDRKLPQTSMVELPNEDFGPTRRQSTNPVRPTNPEPATGNGQEMSGANPEAGRSAYDWAPR